MRRLFVLAALVLLAGCATQRPPETYTPPMPLMDWRYGYTQPLPVLDWNCGALDLEN